MDRNYYQFNQVPVCPSNVELVDQYMWDRKDTTRYRCVNGPATPVYSCNGDIARQLPLHMYPKNNNQVHPDILKDQIFPTGITRKGWNYYRQLQAADIQDRRLTGFYNVNTMAYTH
jgi:hypothetical protein